MVVFRWVWVLKLKALTFGAGLFLYFFRGQKCPGRCKKRVFRRSSKLLSLDGLWMRSCPPNQSASLRASGFRSPKLCRADRKSAQKMENGFGPCWGPILEGTLWVFEQHQIPKRLRPPQSHHRWRGGEFENHVVYAYLIISELSIPVCARGYLYNFHHPWYIYICYAPHVPPFFFVIYSVLTKNHSRWAQESNLADDHTFRKRNLYYEGTFQCEKFY